MKPGIELDILVAEKVMGLEVVHKTWGKENQYESYSIGEPDYYDDRGASILENPVPDYSSDMSAAMEVVRNTRSMIKSNWILETLPLSWKASRHVEVGNDDDNCKVYSAVEKALPHAICLAALKSIGA